MKSERNYSKTKFPIPHITIEACNFYCLLVSPLQYLAGCTAAFKDADSVKGNGHLPKCNGLSETLNGKHSQSTQTFF